MDHTYVDGKSLKNLEDLAVHLTTAVASLMTLQNLQVEALEQGIMPEDMNVRANTIVWDIRRLLNQYLSQLVCTLELLPDDYNGKETIKKLIAVHNKKARTIIRNRKCVT